MKKIALFFFGLTLCFVNKVLAQRHIPYAIDKESSVSLSATVQDYLPPTKAVIKNPKQNDLLATKPDFIWEASTDVNGISHYKLYIDDELILDDLKSEGGETEDYNLRFDEENQTYTLDCKKTISDGEHTIKITAVDNQGGQSTSNVVFFTLDTTQPEFLINQIGETTVNISAKENNLPAEPLIFKKNKLILKALTEIGSSINLKIKDGSNNLEQINNIVVSANPYKVHLGLLPRDKIITLNFEITDKVGNITILEGLKILVESEKIILPPQTATKSAELDNDNQNKEEVVDQLIEIPILPPEEIVNNVIKKVSNIIPDDVKNVAKEVTLNTIKATSQAAKKMAPVAVPITTATTTGFSLFSLLSQLSQLSGNVGLQALQTLGLIKVKRKKGFVFDYSTRQPIPFALLTIKGQGNNINFKETIVTDVYGFYHGVKLPPGKYKIQVEKEGYEFPVQKKYLDTISMNEYYLGESFVVSSNQEIQSFAIPMHSFGEKIKANFNQRMKTFIKNLNLSNKYFFRTMFVFSIIMTTYFPNKLNIFFFVFYFLMFIFRLLKFLKIPIITGLVTDENGKPLTDVLVRINFNDNNDLASLVFTDKYGRFKFYGEKDFYQINLMKDGYIYYQEDAVMSVFFTDTTKKKQNLAFIMMNSKRMQETLFGEKS